VDALLAWIAEKEGGMKEAKFGESLDEAKAAQEALKGLLCDGEAAEDRRKAGH